MTTTQNTARALLFDLKTLAWSYLMTVFLFGVGIFCIYQNGELFHVCGIVLLSMLLFFAGSAPATLSASIHWPERLGYVLWSGYIIPLFIEISLFLYHPTSGALALALVWISMVTTALLYIVMGAVGIRLLYPALVLEQQD